jgi:hypothetical protein
MVRKVYLGQNFQLRGRKSATMERIEAEQKAAKEAALAAQKAEKAQEETRDEQTENQQ